MDAALRVRVLGPLEIEVDGQRRALGSRTQRRLLSALTIACGDAVTVEALIDQLWGEQPPPSARNSLQSHIARLRTIIGPEAIVSRPGGYALDLAVADLDAVGLETAVASARRLLDEEPASAARCLRTALSDWRGDAYAEFLDPVARGGALRLRQLRTEARRLLAEALLRAGRTDEALDTLLALVADEPLREDVVLTAGRTLHELDRTAEALALVREHRIHVADELGLDPGPAVSELERLLLRGEPLARRGPHGDVPQRQPHGPGSDDTTATVAAPPLPYSPTVGREPELAEVTAALARHRLVTLVGPGGVGKTRIAIVVARHQPSGPGDTVAWVDLATVHDAEDVAPVVSEALGPNVAEPHDRESITRALGRFRGLVVLDNCEHVLAPTADLVARALSRPGPARVLVTSRQRLDLAMERVVAVPPLPTPSKDVASDADPAIALFQERLAAAGGSPVPAAEAAEVAEALDGLPLAIELAAARASTLAISELLKRLDTHLDVIAASDRRHGRRQRTLSDVVAWSYALLSRPEQAVFRKLSVFASRFRLADAERVCADEALRPADVVAAALHLVECSMLMREGHDGYRLLTPLRVFAREALAEAPDAQATYAKHRAFVLDLAQRADTSMTGSTEEPTVDMLEAAMPDIRAVHSRAVATRDHPTVAALTARLYRFAYAQARGDVLGWGRAMADTDASGGGLSGDQLRAIAASAVSAAWRNRNDEAIGLTRRYEDRLRDDTVDTWTAAMLAETLGDVRLDGGDLEGACDAYERQTILAQHLGHPGTTSMALSSLSVARTLQGRTEEAEAHALEALRTASSPPIRTARALASYALGEAVTDRDPDAALEAFAMAVEEASRVRARFFEGIARTADVALRGRYGDPDEALARYRAALQLWYDAGSDGMAVTTLRNLVVLLVRTGADEQALALDAALSRLAGRESYGSEARRLAAAIAAATERVPREAAARAVRTGAGLEDVAAVLRFGLTCVDGAGTSRH